MLEEIPAKSAEQSMRERPNMYIGRFMKLFPGLFMDCIRSCKTEAVLFSVAILCGNKFSIDVSSDRDMAPFLISITEHVGVFLFLHSKMLTVSTDSLEISSDNGKWHFHKGELQENKNEVKDIRRLTLDFVFDSDVFRDTNIDFHTLSEEFGQLAILHSKAEILVKDLRGKYLCQEYYSFPDGIFYLYDRLKSEVLGRPKFEIKFEGKIGERQYQIAIGYRTDWYPPPSILSYSNEIFTSAGGSLIDGVLQGLITGCRRYTKVNAPGRYKIKSRKFANGLILVCAVKGEDFMYAGSTKEKLENKEVEKEIKKQVGKLVFDYLSSNKEISETFLFRFDEAQLTSKMFS
ncbi:MAG: Type topoisomerase gyrase/topo topoisomerase subunit-like protein [Bacteroidetes bacterium]|nr:Type topoisomerase gyrase/topo topoisomerase subunit-like protein [Bacteroidota bacterium]